MNGDGGIEYELSNANPKLGEPFKYTIRASVEGAGPHRVTLAPCDRGCPWEAWDLVQVTKVGPDGGTELTVSMSVSVFDLGEQVALPGVRLETDGGFTDLAGATLKVQTVLDGGSWLDGGTLALPGDVHPPEPVYVFNALWAWGGIALLVFLVSALLLNRVLRKKRHTQSLALPPAPVISPRERALNALNTLRGEVAKPSLNPRAFSALVSDAVRHYTADSFTQADVAFSTEELLLALNQALPPRPLEDLSGLLYAADLAAFAPASRSVVFCNDLLEKAFSWVRAYPPAPPPAPLTPGKKAG